jgi:hypothetical protein
MASIRGVGAFCLGGKGLLEGPLSFFSPFVIDRRKVFCHVPLFTRARVREDSAVI